MFNWSFASKLFEGFSILRWTDFIKPVDFVEIEKHALSSALTYLIGREYEAKSGRQLDFKSIVSDNVFGLMHKLATSDIKSPLHAQIKNNEKIELDKFILGAYYDEDGRSLYYPEELAGGVPSAAEFFASLSKDVHEDSSVADRITYFSHKFVTYREFSVIKKLGADSADAATVERYLEHGISDEASLIGLGEDSEDRRILADIFSEFSPFIKGSGGDGSLYALYAYFEKLKPQTRWAQTCRLPMTSVLGHSMYVAALTYFACRELQTDDAALCETFYAALFHDLPESLTRDIISPVKNNVKNLESILNHLEFQLVNDNIVARLGDKAWKEDFCRLLGMDFAKECIDEFGVRYSDGALILGDLVRHMDRIAAFVEAKMSKNFGVTSAELENGIKNSQLRLLNKVYPPYDSDLHFVSRLHLNDFFASIPHYTVGVG